MLQMRPNCQCCDADLPPDSAQAWSCSLACTYCADCAQVRLDGVCPGCGGDLRPRPRRLPATAAKHLPTPPRVLTPERCAR